MESLWTNTTFMTFAGTCLALMAGLALAFSLASYRMASFKTRNSNLSRKLSAIEIEVADLYSQIGSVTKMVKRLNARENMRKHREAKKTNSEMTDEEWRAHATKKLQLGNIDL